MSGKLLFDIQMMLEGGGGPILSYRSSVKIARPPHLLLVSHDGLVLISGEKQRCAVIKERELLVNLFHCFVPHISFFLNRSKTS